MSAATHDIILLTGAGFTKNFDGFLAQEAWARLFNNPQIQKTPKLKALLQNNFDFEVIYSEVFSNLEYSDIERQTLSESLEKMYEDLDQTTNNWIFRDENPTAFNVYGMQELIGLCVGTHAKKRMFFTLNQDLLMERRYHHVPPGVSRFSQDIYNSHASVKGKYVTLPDATTLQKYIDTQFQSSSDLAYIKLHGSYGWHAVNGQNRMVIGKNKTSQIDEEPLLKWYFELFKNCLFEGGKKLLIIGYSFADPHINDVMTEAIQHAGLKLYIITPTKPQDIIKRIDPILWQAVSGYFGCSFRELFPPDQSRTTMFSELCLALKT